MVKFTKHSGKVRIMEAAREKQSLTSTGRQIRIAPAYPQKRGREKGVAGYIQCAESEKYATMNSLSSKAVIQNRRRDKKFPRQTKIKGVCDHETSPARNFKGDSLTGEKMKKKNPTKPTNK